MRLRLPLVLLLLAVIATACDRTPSDPSDGAQDLAVLLLEQAAGTRAPPHSLPSLLQSAIQRVFREQGAPAARTLLRDVRRAQENARYTSESSGESATAQRRAIEAAEIQVILHVFGDEIAAAVVTNVRADAVRLRAELDALAAAGRVVTGARELLAEADELLFDASTALEQRAAFAALDLGTRAAGATDRARLAILDATHVLTLDQLVDSATVRLRSAPGNERLLRIHQDLLLSSRVAVTGRDREAAQKALEAVRSSEIDIVLKGLGERAPQRLLTQADAALLDVAGSLARAREGERSTVRLTRMHASARDLLVRARTALERGDQATALDLGSHAAGLLNSIRASL